MLNVGDKVVINMFGTDYDQMEAIIIGKQDLFFKVQVLDRKKLGENLSLLEYQIKK